MKTLSAVQYIIDAKTGCWDWQRSKNHRGYGLVWDGTRLVPAHRHFYIRVNGPIGEGKQLDHLCKNRGCVNPAHMEQVSPATNTQRGKVAKLDEAKVLKVRELVGAGASEGDVAAIFEIGVRQVRKIVSRQQWRDVA